MKQTLRFIYSLIPLKREAFTLLRRFNLPVSIYKHLHFTGPIEVQVESSTFKLFHFGHQIENELFWKGIYYGWEGISMRIWVALAKDSNTILDIGANTGIYSLTAATINSNARIFAFEPVQRVFERFKANLALNKFDSIQAYELGISNYTGEAKFYDPGGDHVLSISVNKDLTDGQVETVETQIKVKRLDDFIPEEKIEHIDLVKLDVEYHEPEALEGFDNYLRVFQPSFLIEVLTEEIAQQVNQRISGMGYKIFDIDEEKGLTELKAVQKSSTFNILLLNQRHYSKFDKDLLHSLICQ